MEDRVCVIVGRKCGRLDEVVIGRDATPSLFSALGKILHCKRVELLAEPKSLDAPTSDVASSSTSAAAAAAAAVAGLSRTQTLIFRLIDYSFIVIVQSREERWRLSPNVLMNLFVVFCFVCIMFTRQCV